MSQPYDWFESAGAPPARVGRADVYTGICSWADPEFVRGGGFYPRRVASKPDARLRFVAAQFPAVEVDATFFSLLPRSLADRWIGATRPGFLFSVKAFGLFTGQGTDPRRLPPAIRGLLPPDLRAKPRINAGDVSLDVLDACWSAWLAFVDTFADAGRLGYLLFQYPARFRYAKTALATFADVAARVAGRPAAVEFRHRSWVEPKALDFVLGALRAHELAYVVPDEPQLPWTVPPDVHVTADWAVVRFHGHNDAAWSMPGGGDPMNDYEYGDEELAAWAARVRELAGQVRRVYASFNNFPRMAATASRFAALLRA